MAQLTQTTRQHLAALAPVQPTGLKMGQAQAAKYDFHRLLPPLGPRVGNGYCDGILTGGRQ